jgi:hypothetical protein
MRCDGRHRHGGTMNLDWFELILVVVVFILAGVVKGAIKAPADY